MTTTETRPDTEVKCRRCHGTGLEPMPKAPVREFDSEEQRQLLERMVELGKLRAGANRHTLVGRQTLDEVYQEVRVQAAEAERIGVTRVHMMEAFGVSKAAFYKILSGETGAS